MAHAFDTALATPQRTLIRTAVVNRLAALKVPTLYLQAVKPIAGKVDATEEGLAAVRRELGAQVPALLVYLSRKTYEPMNVSGRGDRYNATLEVIVYAIVNQARNMMSRVAADVVSAASLQADPGLDTILEHVEELLIGFPIAGSNSTTYLLKPTLEDEVLSLPEITIWEQRYDLKLVRALERDKGVTQLITDVQTTVHQDGAPTEDDRIVLTTLEPA